MNCEVFQLRELKVELSEVQEVLRCILHTIMFHRALGLVRPKDIHCELLEITYVQCGDAELEKKIEEKIDHFVNWAKKHPNKQSQQVRLSFYEVKNKQASWFSNKVERLDWECWYINLHVIDQKTLSKSYHAKSGFELGGNALEERPSRRATLEASLREVLFQIIKFVNEKKDHIPSVSILEGVSFPYEITIPSSSDSSFGMDMFKRMLQSGHPTMLS